MAIVYLCLVIIAFLFGVMLIRTIQNKQRPEINNEKKEDIDVDIKNASIHLSNAIQKRTVSDSAFYEEQEFEDFISMLSKFYPESCRVLELKRINKFALLYRWKGEDSDSPLVLMSHYDVVPANESDWKHPAFSGEIVDDIIWGRGTLDTKTTLICAFEAVEYLLKTGFKPKKDVYLSFGCDEELGGLEGTAKILEYFIENNIKPGLVLDEGGAIVEDVFPGVTKPLAMVGVAEKGVTELDLVVKGRGGHASTPPTVQPGFRLAKALKNIIEHPFHGSFPEATKAMFKNISPYASFGIKFVFTNLWFFEPLLVKMFSKKGGEMNAMTRTTTAITMLQGADAQNVLPNIVKAHLNVRIAIGQTVESTIKYLKKVINDEEVSIEISAPGNPSPVSNLNGEVFDCIRKTIDEVYPGTITTPYVVMGATDARYYANISKNVYRLSPITMSKAQRASMHAVNEMIPVQSLKKGIEFYIRFIKRAVS